MLIDVVNSTMMNNFDQDELMLADLSTDYNPDDIIDHINVNELIYSSCNNFAPWTGHRRAVYVPCRMILCIFQCCCILYVVTMDRSPNLCMYANFVCILFLLIDLGELKGYNNIIIPAALRFAAKT